MITLSYEWLCTLERESEIAKERGRGGKKRTKKGGGGHATERGEADGAI